MTAKETVRLFRGPFSKEWYAVELAADGAQIKRKYVFHPDDQERLDAAFNGPVTDAEADAAQTAFHEYVVGADEPLTERDLRVGRQAWKVAIQAARALADKETP